MAQSTTLAAGKTDTDSSSVALTNGSDASIGLFVASNKQMPSDFPDFKIFMTTPGEDIEVDRLGPNRLVVFLRGPGTFKVHRPQLGTSVGIGVFDDQ